ncbi:hypothetical protein Q3G72_025351 [Acer saccharum]|nr:hypothetical protein Q3G72_025351 [Acer saccharum]
MKFGGLFCEPLLVEEESCLKRRADKGRFLALIKNFRTVPKVVNVVIEKEVFPETKLVPYSWLSNLLGLSDSLNLNSPPVGERFGVNHKEESCSIQIGEKPIWKRKRTDLGDNIGEEVQVSLRNGKSEADNSGNLVNYCLYENRDIGLVKEGDYRGRLVSGLDVNGPLVCLSVDTSSDNVVGDYGRNKNRVVHDPKLHPYVGFNTTQAEDIISDLSHHLDKELGEDNGVLEDNQIEALLGEAQPDERNGVKMVDNNSKSTPSKHHDSLPVTAKKKRGGKRANQQINHNMTTKRSDRISQSKGGEAVGFNRDMFIKEDIVPMVKKAYWNLRDKIAKVIKVRKVLGFDVEGREKDIVEEIVRRIKYDTFDKKGFCRANN